MTMMSNIDSALGEAVRNLGVRGPPRQGCGNILFTLFGELRDFQCAIQWRTASSSPLSAQRHSNALVQCRGSAVHAHLWKDLSVADGR